MADTNYQATLMKMKGWLDANLSEVVSKVKLYGELTTAIDTGSLSPNNIVLTAEQIEHLAGEKTEVEQWVEVVCSAWDVEPIEE